MSTATVRTRTTNSADGSLGSTLGGPGQHFAAFCERYIRHTKGRWAGQPLILEPFQREFVDEVYTLDEYGRRRYTETLLGLARKNGKSTWCAALALYQLIADGESGPEVYVAAAARDQARVVFDQAVAMVEANPALADFVKVQRYHIACPANHGILRVLSSDAPKQHGLNPSAVIIDELHAHESGELYTALTTGSGAREQPLTVTITTAGWNTDTILGRIYERAVQLPRLERRPYLTIGRDPANGFLFWWFGAPDDAPIDDPAVWKGCNPASWITVDYLRKQREKPSMDPASFARLHLNRWVAAEQTWLPPGSWDACLDRSLELDPGLPLGVGIDVGQTFDATAVAMAQKQGERIVLRCRVWANPYDQRHPQHAAWMVNLEEIRAFLRDLARDFPVAAGAVDGEPQAGPAFAYDPWSFRESAEMLAQEGLNMVEFGQFNSHMVPASAAMYEAVVSGRLAHDGDPTLSRHVANATSQLTPRGWRISKPKRSSHLRNDAAVAAAMAVFQATRPAPTPVLSSVFETRGLYFI